MLEIRSELVADGYRLYLARRREGLLRRTVSFTAVPDWELGLASLHPLTAAIIDELEHDGNLSPDDSGSRHLGFAAAAGMKNSDAEALNLLPPFPFRYLVWVTSPACHPCL